MNKVIQVHEDEGIRTGLLVSTGSKWLGVIWPESTGMKIQKVPADSKYKELDYPIERAKYVLLRCGRNFGITKSCSRALAAA